MVEMCNDDSSLETSILETKITFSRSVCQQSLAEAAQNSIRMNISSVVSFLLGYSPASEVYMPTFRNSLSAPFSKAGTPPPYKME
jgi:hypothetical protein